MDSNLPKIPFYKKKLWKVSFLILGLFLILATSLAGYIYAQGARVFENNLNSGRSFFKNFKVESNLKGSKEGRINILFLGMGGSNHPGGQLTDSIMILSLNTSDKTVALLSIPRDLSVPVADHKTRAKINEVSYIGDKDKRGTGPLLTSKTLGKILDIPIHYYITLDFAGFAKIIDEVGGVDVYVDKTLYDPLFPDKQMEGYNPFYLKAGDHHLNGELALKYARSRETSSDFDRAGRQQKILIATKEKLVSRDFLANPKKVLDLIGILGDHLRTNIAPNEMNAFAEVFKGFDTSRVVSKVLSNGEDGPLVADSSTGTYYLFPRNGDYDILAGIAQNIFNSSYKVNSKLKIEVLNGTDTPGLASKFAETLSKSDFEIVNIDNSPQNYDKSVIYDFSGGKKVDSLNYLKERLKIDKVIENAKKSDQGAIFSIIIGQDYLTGNSQTSAPEIPKSEADVAPQN